MIFNPDSAVDLRLEHQGVTRDVDMKRIDLDVVCIETVGMMIQLHFLYNAPRRLMLFSPVEQEIGKEFHGNFVIDSEYGRKVVPLVVNSVRSERQLTRRLVDIIHLAIMKEYDKYHE